MGMVDDHDHGEEGHGHEQLPVQRAVTKPLVLALAITVSFAVFELVGGWLSNSLALISDAGHMFTDVLALALSLGAAIIALREPTEKQTFGYLRVEIVAALLNGIALAVLAVIIIYEAFVRFQDPQDIDAELMLHRGLHRFGGQPQQRPGPAQALPRQPERQGRLHACAGRHPILGRGHHWPPCSSSSSTWSRPTR